ncbi:hypothetical protein SDC9_96290 [bioreactor metagenome]|uniref:Uncharacterized protein n=1 Tax=bioreactor metagenome TaxID=1076179 RepID=A0A645A8Q7_9ZZZZ
MSTEKEKQLSHDVLSLILALAILLTITKLWPILLLVILGLFAYALWMLVRIETRPTAVPPPALLALPAPVSEQEVLAKAFGLLQRRITEQITAVYPNAKWVWSAPGARELFAAGAPLTILLNRAGGFQKAVVQVSNLQLYSLIYLPQTQQGPAAAEADAEPETPSEGSPAEEVDYGLLAFEWVDANLQRLNAQCNEVIAHADAGFRIPAEELPHGDSWPAVCEELVRSGFAAAQALANGIQVQINQQKGA